MQAPSYLVQYGTALVPSLPDGQVPPRNRRLRPKYRLAADLRVLRLVQRVQGLAEVATGRASGQGAPGRYSGDAFAAHVVLRRTTHGRYVNRNGMPVIWQRTMRQSSVVERAA